MRKHPSRWLAFGAATLVAASLLVACSSKSEKQPSNSVKVRADKAGTYHLGDLTVTVPAGAVPRDTQLSATKPVIIDRKSAPLGAASVQFDLSLADGLEPTKPLDVAIPLRGGYLPSGANPAQALLYTPAPDGRGQRLVPATVDGNNVLHAQLVHLSPKTVTYADDQTLMNLAGVGAPNSTTSPSDCQVSVTTPTGKVQFTSANKNWSGQGNSPVFACLALDGSNAKLSIINRLSHILAVASTDGLTLSTNSGDAEEELVKKLADKMFPPDKAIKTYLGRDDVLTTPLPPASLPATVQLKADPSTFLAEAAWSSLKFLVGVVSGVQGNELAKVIDKLADATDVVGCLQATLKIGQGNVPSFGEVYGLVTSKCTEQIVAAVGAYAADRTAWNKFWNRFFVVGEGVGTAWNTFWTSVDGIRMQFNGTVSVVVDNAAPSCPSDEAFLAVARSKSPYKETMRIQPGSKVCDGSWVYARVQWHMPDSFGGWSDPMHVVLRYVGGQWTVYHFKGTARYWIGQDHVCDPLPPKVLAKLVGLP
jgi:hypothetical protein